MNESVIPEGQTVVKVFQQRALNQPHQNLYISLKNGKTESGRLNCQVLDQRAQAIAKGLYRQGLKPGDRALLCYPLEESLAFIEAFWGCLYAGIVAVTAWAPLSTPLRLELQYKAKDAAVVIGLTTQTLIQDLNTSITSATEQPLPWLATNQLPEGAMPDSLLPDLHPETLAYLQYTSGSTGVPKGAMISHGNIMHNLALMHDLFQYDARHDRGVSWLPLSHDMGLVGGVLQAPYEGCEVILISPLDFLRNPLCWLAAISKYRATVSGAPNFAYDRCIQTIPPEVCQQLDLSSWQIAINGAEPIPMRTLTQFTEHFKSAGFRGEAFCPSYGMAETTVLVSGSARHHPPVLLAVDANKLTHNQVKPIAIEQPGSQTLVGCGQVKPTHQVRIVNPDTLEPCPDREIGEIWIANGSVAQGYWHQAEATVTTFEAQLAKDSSPTTRSQTFLRTGDLGFIHDQELFITGRLKDIVIIWGRNHFPQHLEETVRQSHPSLAATQGAAFSYDLDGQEALVIAQEIPRQTLKTLETHAVFTAIGQALAEHHFLEAQQIVLLQAGRLPRTPSGKIQRSRCREQFLKQELTIIEQWQNPQPIQGITIDTEKNFDELE